MRLTWLVFLPATLVAAEPADSPEFFEKRVRPVLVEHCHKCHADIKGKEPKGGLRVDGRAVLLKGGDNGPSIVAGDANKSLLVKAIRYKDPDLVMPPRGKLSDAQIADIEAWVNAGAAWPNDTSAGAAAASGFDVEKRKREHWAWQPVKPVDPPAVKDAAWPIDPADKFLLAKLEAKGIKPAPPAEKRVWVRRVTFALTGLPPTPGEIDAFVRDQSTDAKKKVVDRLLDSPHFGEQWGRHWLDLVRYAETRGHEFDAIIPNAFQYRDYVIRALNADVPYDRFVKEHVAGDLLPTPRKNPAGFNESILGTGFWFLGEEVHSPVDIRQDQADRFDNRIDVLTKTFLALTVSCARCHDHKFDAISTKDYYALYGFLESSGYRQVRFETAEKNREVAERLDRLDRGFAKSMAKELSAAAWPLSERLADYLLAAREVMRQPAAGEVFEDFESGDYKKWTVTGKAFGDAPQTLATTPAYQGKINALGKFFVNSHNVRPGGDTAVGDALVGEMLSKEFTVSRSHITMWVGGGSHAGKTCVNLLIDGKPVRTATGRDHNQMFPVKWDVRDLKGKTARFQIVDAATGGWGNVGVDEIRFADSDDGSPTPETIAAVAKDAGLSADALYGLVAELRLADKDPTHVLHVWAKFGGDMSAKRIQDLRVSPPAAKVDVVIDYATAEPHEFLPDDGSYGLGPVRPGDLERTSAGVRFATVAAARFDKAWTDLQPSPGTETDPGAIGRRPRVGKTIRTPNFRVGAGKVHFLVAGGGTAYAAIDGHVLVEGPLHGGIVIDFPHQPGFRWVTHDLKAYAGHAAHIEFSPGKENDFAVAMVVQGDAPPPMPPAYVPKGEIASADGLARAYQDALSKDLDANWLNVLRSMVNDKVQKTFDQAEDRRAKSAKAVITASRYAPAMYEGTGLDEHVFIRGAPRALGDKVPRRFLEAFVGTKPITTEPGSGRLELAEQMTRPEVNPLVARVAVNRIWHHLFGRGIVASVDNFGVLGDAPTHPELLDHLADRFVRDGWSTKKMIRELVLSRAYGMSSAGETAAADPQNLLLHRFRLRRLEGEAIRDAILQVSGRLDRTAFGPSVPIQLTPFLDGRGRPGKSGPVDGDGRRSIYLAVRRNFLHPMLLAFDTPIPFSTVGRRQVSNVPAQALILMNDPFVHGQAAVWSKRVREEHAGADDRIRSMYLTVFGRPANADEVAACGAFVVEQTKELGNDKAWDALCHTLLNGKEFIYVD